MVKPEIIKILNGINNSPYGKALNEYLTTKYDEIKDVSTIDSSKGDIAVQTIGRQEALKILKEVMSFIESKPTVDKKTNPYT